MKEKPLTADEVFVSLISVAREDEKIGKFVKAVVSMGDFDRTSVINTFMREMALKGAPAELIKAIAALRDREISAKVNELLSGSGG